MLPDGRIRRDIRRSTDLRAAAAVIDFSSHANLGFRELMAAALTDVAFEHHCAIGLLLKFEQFSSAQAMLRPCVEASLRAIWVLQCATEDEIAQLQGGKSGDWPDLERVIGRIEGKYRQGGFVRKLLPSRKVLNDLTHTGSLQIIGRIMPTLSENFVGAPPAIQIKEATAALCIRTSDQVLAMLAIVVQKMFGSEGSMETVAAKAAEVRRSYELDHRG